jgi:CheY-like chemotaxis protein
MASLLIVDDSQIQRGLIREFLRDGNHEIREVETGGAALGELDHSRPDCVILDLLMPEMGGLDVLRRMQERGVRTPVIVTGLNGVESTQEVCRQLGAAGWVHKPIDRDELLEEVERVLRLIDPLGEKT